MIGVSKNFWYKEKGYRTNVVLTIVSKTQRWSEPPSAQNKNVVWMSSFNFVESLVISKVLFLFFPAKSWLLEKFKRVFLLISILIISSIHNHWRDFFRTLNLVSICSFQVVNNNVITWKNRFLFNSTESWQFAIYETWFEIDKSPFWS